MRGSHRFAAIGIGIACLFVLASCQQRSTITVCNGPSDETVTVGDVAYRISGPFVHENLTVFLLSNPDAALDATDYLTLDQGLKDGLVKVTEKGEGQVEELLIDNQSDRPLFLQEGDRVQGGKQDRTLYSSLIVPEKSGPMPVPTFCIEPNRWSEGSMGKDFCTTANAALAPKEVRQAAKLGKDQGKVWDAVRDQKARATEVLNAPNTNTSLNETLDSDIVKKASEAAAAALQNKLAENPDACGVAVMVNGKVEEVNIYPNPKLLNKVFPRLIQSYAVQAAIQKPAAAAEACTTCDPAEIARFLVEGRERQAMAVEKVNADNRLQTECIDDNKVYFSTVYREKPVHQQFLSRSPAPPPGRDAQMQRNQVEDGQQLFENPRPRQGDSGPNPPNPPPAPQRP